MKTKCIFTPKYRKLNGWKKITVATQSDRQEFIYDYEKENILLSCDRIIGDFYNIFCKIELESPTFKSILCDYLSKIKVNKTITVKDTYVELDVICVDVAKVNEIIRRLELL